MISYEEALERIEEACEVLPIVEVPLREALGGTLAEAVHLSEDLPLFDNSAMDGFALIAVDLLEASEAAPVGLSCSGTLGAGDSLSASVVHGACWRIMTGAPIPPGADAVVPVEKTRIEGDRVLFSQPVPEGSCIRRRGEEMKAGELLLESGTPIDAVAWGLLATADRPRVYIHRRPKVALLITGNELVEPGEELRPGAIRNSNSYTLLGVLSETGVETIDLGVALDDREILKTRLVQGAEADALITVGGVSAGEFDHIRDLLAEGFCGFEEVFYKLRIRPGKPVRFGKMGRTVVFALPGNPVSCLVGFHLLVKPALRKMWGFREWRNPVYKARLRGSIESPAPVLNFWRGRMAFDPDSCERIAVPKEKAGSGMLTTFLGADGFIPVPIDKQGLSDGEMVDFIPIGN